MASAIDPLLQKLNVRLIAPLSRQIGSFWTWWYGELVALLPAGLRDAIAAANKRILITLKDTDIVFSERTDAGWEGLGSHSLAAPEAAASVLPEQVSELVLCLPPDQVLTRSLTLPLVAEENLREVLSFELDRQTPFTAEQAYYDYYVKERNAAQGSITVELVVSPRSIVDELLEKLARIGIEPDTITTRVNDSAPTMPVNLLPVSTRRRPRLAAPRLNTGLAAVGAILLVVALLLPLWLNKQKVTELELQQSAAEVVAKDGLALRHDVESLTAASEFLLNKKLSGVLVLQILEEVTRVLPNNTWLARFDVNDSEVQLQGQSSAAAALIELLESSPMFRNARFRSPVVQVPRTDLERFHLSIELEAVDTS